MQKTTELSIIIPVYNCKAYLSKCFGSIFQQHLSDFEVLVIDDGSTDGTTEWLAENYDNHPNVTVISQVNQGVVKARNLGLAKARGKYVAFLDADDFWYDRKIAEQLAFMQANSQCTLTFSNYMHFSETGEPIIDCFNYWTEFDQFRQPATTGYYMLNDGLNAIFAINVVGTSTVIAKRSALIQQGGFDPSLPSASDWELWLRLASDGQVGCCNHITTGYIIREGAISRNQSARVMAMEVIISGFSQSKQLTTTAWRMARGALAQAQADLMRSKQRRLNSIYFSSLAAILCPGKRNFKQWLSDLSNLVGVG